MATSERRITAVCFALAILPLIGFWTYGLFDLDEGFYAAAAREMLRRGEWITPYYNGQAWFEKPILLYWLAIPSIRVFGEAIGPRLPSVICSIGTIWTLFGFVKRCAGLPAARATILVYGSSLLAIGVGRMMLADPPLVLAMTLTFCLFFDSIQPERRLSTRIWAGLALGFAVLAKGPVGALLFVIVAVIEFWGEPRLRPGYRGGWLVASLVFAGVVSLWYVPAYLANDAVFVQKFLIEQNLGRFTGGDAAHSIGGPANWLFYLVILAAGMLPWSFFLPWAWPRKEGDGGAAAMRRYCAIWALVVIVFFSLSGAKLPHYIAPALPALAAIIGSALVRRGVKQEKRTLIWGGLACGIAFLVVNSAFWFYYHGLGSTVPGFHDEVHQLTRWVKEQGGQVAVYQMSRRESDLGTGSMRLKETAHPSILFYLDADVVDTDRLDDLLRSPVPLWIITRNNRIGEADIERAREAGFTLRQAETSPKQDLYRVYRLSR